MLTRVSNVEAYRRWVHWEPRWDGDEEPTIEEFVRSLIVDEPTGAMLAGTAFHAAIENAQVGEHNTFSANGFTFHLPDAEIEIGDIREMRASKRYGELTVTGKVDCLEGRLIADHKTTSKVDIDRYMEGYQWRYYLDIFGADVFRWHLFEIKELEPKVYRVAAPQLLEAYRYPELADDCALLADQFRHFALSVKLPDARID
jgi:hypothetical protein